MDLRKTVLVIFFILAYGFHTNANEVQFNSVPNWNFKKGESEDKLFNYKNKHLLGILTKVRGDAAASLFVFSANRAKLKQQKQSPLNFLSTEILPSKAKLIKQKKINKDGSFGLRTYNYKDSVIYVYVYMSVNNVYYLTQNTTQKAMRLDVDATMPELSRLKIID